MMKSVSVPRYNKRIVYASNVKNVVLKTIKTMIKLKINPSIQVSSGYKYDIYYVNKLDLQQEEEIIKEFYDQLVSCIYDYPEKNIHLIGYSEGMTIFMANLVIKIHVLPF